MHVTLDQFQPGSYVVIRDVAPYGLTKQVGKYMGATQEETVEIMREKGVEFLLIVLRNMIKEWSIKDEDGNLVQELPQDIPVEKLDTLDGWMLDYVVNKASDAAMNRRMGDPNVSTAS